MSRSLRQSLQVAILGLASLGLPSLQATCNGQASAGGAPSTASQAIPTQMLDLDFRGGRATEYLDAIQQAAGGKINIVAMPHVEEITVPPMKLRNVDVVAAVRLLDGEEMVSNERAVQLSVQFIGMPDAQGATPLLKVNAYVKEPKGYTGPQRSSIWSVSDLIAGGMTADNISTAVSAALELLGPDAQKAQVRFHKETSLLLARAKSDQINIINEVVDQLRESNAQKQSQSTVPIRQQAEEMKARLVEMQAKMEAMNGEMGDRLRVAETAKARGEAMERRAAELETVSSRLRDEVASRESLVRELQSRIGELETQIQQLKAQRGKGGG